jgi:hypothetical protein
VAGEWLASPANVCFASAETIITTKRARVPDHAGRATVREFHRARTGGHRHVRLRHVLSGDRRTLEDLLVKSGGGAALRSAVASVGV